MTGGHGATRAGSEARALCERVLLERGVRVDELASLVFELQQAYVPGLDLAACTESVEAVLAKREVCNALLTGVALDRLAEERALPEPLLSTILRDDPLYGIDEVLALSIVNIYGSIGFTNFGHLDKVKPGVVGRVDRERGDGLCNTFLDDLLAAVVAAAASRIAHRHRDTWAEPATPAPEGGSADGPAGAR